MAAATEHPPNPRLRPSVAAAPAVVAAAAATSGTPYSGCPLFVSFSNLLRQEALEVGEVITVYIGDGTHFHPAFAPVNPVIAKLSAGERLRISFSGRPDEN